MIKTAGFLTFPDLRSATGGAVGSVSRLFTAFLDCGGLLARSCNHPPVPPREAIFGTSLVYSWYMPGPSETLPKLAKCSLDIGVNLVWRCPSCGHHDAHLVPVLFRPLLTFANWANRGLGGGRRD